MEVVFPIVFTVIPIVLVLALVSAQMKRVREADQLAQTGTPARGIVLTAARQRSMRIAYGGRSFEQRSLVLEIEIPGQAPYEASVNALIPGTMAKNVLPGATIDLRIDPRNPQNIAVVPPDGFSLAAVAGAPAPGLAQPVAIAAPGVRVNASASPVLIGVLAVSMAGAGAAAFVLTQKRGGEEGASDDGWCKAAATCCKAAGGSVAACNGFKNMPADACKRAYDGQKKAASAAGKKCR